MHWFDRCLGDRSCWSEKRKEEGKEEERKIVFLGFPFENISDCVNMAHTKCAEVARRDK